MNIKPLAISLALLGCVAIHAPAATADAATEPNICAGTLQTGALRDIEAICQHGRDWITAFKAGDIDALMALYMPDAQVALHGQHKLRGKDAIRAFFAPALAARPKVEFLLHVEEIRVEGDLGYLVSRYWYTSQTPEGKLLQDAGRSLLIYRRARTQHGKPVWKIQFDIDQASPDVSFPAPASAR